MIIMNLVIFNKLVWLIRILWFWLMRILNIRAWYIPNIFILIKTNL